MAAGLVIQGADRLIAKLAAEPLWDKAVRRLLSRVGLQGKQAGMAAAPVAAGRLRSSISSRLSSKAIPTFVSIRVGATSPRGYPYPKVLEFSAKHHHKGWLAEALRGAKSSFATFLSDAARDIERTFGSK